MQIGCNELLKLSKETSSRETISTCVFLRQESVEHSRERPRLSLLSVFSRAEKPPAPLWVDSINFLSVHLREKELLLIFFCQTFGGDTLQLACIDWHVFKPLGLGDRKHEQVLTLWILLPILKVFKTRHLFWKVPSQGVPPASQAGVKASVGSPLSCSLIDLHKWP